jgi:1-acyl-sn-glycerol-3-phosphate acyltransferase
MDPRAPTNTAPSTGWPAWIRRAKDIAITLCLWGYFLGAFWAIFFPFYLGAAIFRRNRRMAIQRLNHLYFRGFIFLCRRLAPRQKWQIDDRVRRIRSSVVVSNHLSYIDPVLLVALFYRFTTIAKDRLFTKPIFGHILALSGFLPSRWQGRQTGLLLDSWETLPSQLAEGANLVVFPEGTRSRSGAVGTFRTGIFKIARFYRAPINVIAIRNTDKLFEPGKFAFNTCEPNTISVEFVEEIHPEYDDPDFSIQGLVHQVRTRLMHHLGQS